ncbi:hypothetical protein D3C72_1710590 [compost metagenome]
MRNAAHHVHAHVERALQVVQRAGRAQHAVLRERHQLQVQVGAHALAHVQQRLHREQPRIAHVHMRADRQQPARHRPVAVGQRALDQRLLRQHRLELAPQRNAFEQRARLVHARQPVRQCGVHVEVRIDERRRHQVAGRIDLVGGVRGQCRLNRGDAARGNADIDAGAPVGQVAVPQDQVEHGVS